MENVCDRMLELDRGRCFMHNFGGPGSYEQFKEVGVVARLRIFTARAKGIDQAPPTYLII